jgi:hypothetical protein
MQDAFVREALLAYAADEPPMTLTSEGVLAAGRRSRRLRRVLAVAGSVAGLASLAGLFLFVPGPVLPAPPAGPSWSGLDTEALCTAADRPATPVTGLPTSVRNESGYNRPVPTEPTDHAAARLSCYLMREIPRLLPGAIFQSIPGAPPGLQPLQVHDDRPGGLAKPVDRSLPYYVSSAIVEDGNGVGTVGFGISPAGGSAADAAADCGGTTCAVRTGPHGEVITVSTLPAFTLAGNAGSYFVTINIYMGQTLITASASNQDIREPSHGTGAPPAGRADLPLSVDQLIAIGTASQLSLFP